jgi:hypothetical protein
MDRILCQFLCLWDRHKQFTIVLLPQFISIFNLAAVNGSRSLIYHTHVAWSHPVRSRRTKTADHKGLVAAQLEDGSASM